MPVRSTVSGTGGFRITEIQIEYRERGIRVVIKAGETETATYFPSGKQTRPKLPGCRRPRSNRQWCIGYLFVLF